MARLSLSLFGAFQATRAGQPLVGFESIKVRALLAYLAVEAGRPHRREALANLLWHDFPDETARTNLRQAIANLRLVLGDRRVDSPLLLVTRDAIQFNLASDHELDVAAFTSLLAACSTHRHRHAAICTWCTHRQEQAIRLYHGAFLSEFLLGDSAAFEEWAALKREHFHQQVLGALAHLVEHHERRGAYEQAQHHARHQLALDSWDEQAHRHLMRLLWLNGQRSAALAQYTICRRILQMELGVEPDAETTALYERIGRGNADTDSIVGSAPNNLAAHTGFTAFVGREEELVRITERLELQDCRLLTLVGLGGVGKTRLALEAAKQQLGSFRDGVYFVPLAPLNTPEQIFSTIANVLELTLAGAESPLAQLKAYLREKELLLVLDNFEHLLAGVDDLLALLRSAPTVRLLVTSREPLNIRGEWLVPIEGMSLPLRELAPNAKAYGAVKLFEQTAQHVRPTFVLSDENTVSVMRICKLVEGLPLAIELAAAWIRSHTCGQIAQQLEHSLDYLATTMRDIPERHRSVRAVFDYSWKWLSADEQRLFRQLSVFRGGCLLESAERVASASPTRMLGLVNKSLLRCDCNGRYDMHELVRQYAAEKLEQAEEQTQTQDRHLVYVLELVAQADAALVGPQRRVWLDRLNAESNNIRVALEWCKARGYGELWLCLAAMLWLYWEASGRLLEGITWLAEGLEHTRNQLVQMRALEVSVQRTTRRVHGAASMRAHALVGAAQLGRHYGDLVRAHAWAEESLALCHAANDQWGIAASLNILGRVVRDRGDLDCGERCLEESLSIYRALNDSEGISYSLMSLAAIVNQRGNALRAKEMNEESLTLSRARGDHRGSAWALQFLGNFARSVGNYAQATELLEESLALFREQQVKPAIVQTLLVLGQTAWDRGDYSAARVWLEESLALQREIGNRQVIATLLEQLESTVLQLGDNATAQALYEERLTLQNTLPS